MKVNTLHAQDTHLGFQIAPMIDVVFVIMLFFMVMAGAIKAERLLATKLTGPMPEICEVVLPTEVLINISEDGVVAMNDEAYDAARGSLPELTAAQ